MLGCRLYDTFVVLKQYCDGATVRPCYDNVTSMVVRGKTEILQFMFQKKMAIQYFLSQNTRVQPYVYILHCYVSNWTRVGYHEFVTVTVSVCLFPTV